jgi:hypothetical protein
MLLSEALGLPLRQAEVDFVIPNLEKDLNLYVDPFLFYRSDSRAYQAVHATLHEFFATAIEHVRQGRGAVAERMLDFPEVRETMLGMTKHSHKGHGMGDKGGRLIYDEIVSNADILKKGITHLAEMQLLIEGVGYDLISDMCTNIAKPFFIDYTQNQALLHGIPLEKGVCLEHVFDWGMHTWDDAHYDLPVNPKSGYPILLIPKDVVRRFPVFDFRNFWTTTYRYVLREREIRSSVRIIGKKPKDSKITWKFINQKYGFSKKVVVKALHQDPSLRHKYVDTLEKKKKAVIEAADLFKVPDTDRQLTKADVFAKELTSIVPGVGDSKRYERMMLRILTKLFSPPLTNPKAQVSSHDGREIVDLTYYNSANEGFWKDVKDLWRSQIVVFELKNIEDLGNEEFFQINARLDDVRGEFGVLVSRKKDNLDLERAYRRLNKERKVILTLSDADILAMLKAQDEGTDPTEIFRNMYRSFIDKQ